MKLNASVDTKNKVRKKKKKERPGTGIEQKFKRKVVQHAYGNGAASDTYIVIVGITYPYIQIRRFGFGLRRLKEVFQFIGVGRSLI